MKKLKNLTFACLLILGLAACADDNKSSNPPVTDNSVTVTSEFTGKIGEGTENTITFTNPYATEANLEVYVSGMIDSSITIDSSTCSNFNNGYNSFQISTKLAAGESCEVKYTYTPTKLDTILLKLSIDYNQANEAICPTTDYVPTDTQVMNSYKNIDMLIYNYAEDSSGTKSPDIINVEINPEWYVSGLTNGYTNPFHYSQTFNLPAKKGEYSFNNYGIELTSNNNNCSISGSTLTVNNDNGCSITYSTTIANITSIQFSPKEEANPYYNVNVNINSNYTYNLFNLSSAPYYNTFRPEYYAANTSEEYYIDADILKNGEKITSYEITGTNKDKFKVASTKHNGCTVTDTEISIPAGQENCFFTIEITDKTESGTFTATLNTTLSTGSTNTYNIDGTVSLLTIQDMLQNYCKQSSQNKENNKQYKLF